MIIFAIVILILGVLWFLVQCMKQQPQIKIMPKCDNYYSVDPDGTIFEHIMISCAEDYAMFYSGNFFLTEEEAEKNKSKVMKKFGWTL